jgi:hypothetical protein
MPTNIQEILGVLIVILVIWFLLKMAKVAIRLIFSLIAVILIVGAVYYFLLR